MKAQRGGSMRAFLMTPDASVPWLTESLATFGDRLGSVFVLVPSNVRRAADGAADARLAAFLSAWPAAIPLAIEFQHESWHVDETFDALRAKGASLVTTELPEAQQPPDIRVTGVFLYLRLRRHDYDSRELEAWAGRLQPFLDAGRDAFVFFRHDDTGRATELARELQARVETG